MVPSRPESPPSSLLVLQTETEVVISVFGIDVHRGKLTIRPPESSSSSSAAGGSSVSRAAKAEKPDFLPFFPLALEMTDYGLSECE